MFDPNWPAFPVASDAKLGDKMGLTLREYFAAAALQGMVYAHDYSTGACDSAIAERAFAIADAMLRESAKPMAYNPIEEIPPAIPSERELDRLQSIEESYLESRNEP